MAGCSRHLMGPNRRKQLAAAETEEKKKKKNHVGVQQCTQRPQSDRRGGEIVARQTHSKHRRAQKLRAPQRHALRQTCDRVGALQF